MKALVKNNDVLCESNWSPFVKSHLDWMIESERYTLVENYIPSSDPEEMMQETVEEPMQEVKETVIEEPVTETVTYYEFGGKQYTATELKELISKL